LSGRHPNGNATFLLGRNTTLSLWEDRVSEFRGAIGR
jgi:hypothetical protein